MIQLDSVSKSFQSGRGKTRAVTSVSLSIETGCFAVIVGRSGSGKTTLLNCMGGLEKPDAGTVACFGTPVHSMGRCELSLFQRRNMGFVFQQGNLLSYLNVYENIGFPLRLNNMVGRKRDRRIHELLERIDLLSAARALPHELSGGEAQRVAIARAVAHYPKLLLADEPTASLDSFTGQKAVSLIQELGKADMCTVVVATHDPDVAKKAAKTFYLKDGCIEKEAE
jgi:ABC-type lipoprotein export system ATPase subunit